MNCKNRIGLIPAHRLNARLNALSEALGLEETRAAQLESRVATLTGSLQAAEDEIATQGALIATLTWQFTHEAVKWSQRDTPPGTPTVSATRDAADAPGQRNRHLNASIASMEVLSQRAELGGGKAADEAWAAIDADRAYAATGGEHILEITTSADTWVEIFGQDDRQLEMDLIRAGTQREYNDSGPFRIMVGVDRMP